MSEGARELYQPLINITSGLIRAATVMAGRPLPFQSASFGPSLSLPLPHRPTDATVTTGNGFVHTDMKRGGRKDVAMHSLLDMCHCALVWELN